MSPSWRAKASTLNPLFMTNLLPLICSHTCLKTINFILRNCDILGKSFILDTLKNFFYGCPKKWLVWQTIWDEYFRLLLLTINQLQKAFFHLGFPPLMCCPLPVPQLSYLDIRYWIYGVQTGSWFSTINILLHLLSFKVPASSSTSLAEKVSFFKIALIVFCHYSHWISLDVQWKIYIWSHLFNNFITPSKNIKKYKRNIHMIVFFVFIMF